MVGWFLRQTNCYNKKCFIKSYLKSSFDVSRIGRNLVTYIEGFMNNRLLADLDEGFVKKEITPYILIHDEPTTFLEESGNSLETVNDILRRMRYLKRCRNQLRKKWENDYIKALMERRQPKHKKDPTALDNGRVILYKDYLKDNQKWRLDKIIGLTKGKDSVLRRYKIKADNGYIIERPIGLVVDSEIGKETSENVTELNEPFCSWSNQGQNA